MQAGEVHLLGHFGRGLLEGHDVEAVADILPEECDFGFDDGGFVDRVDDDEGGVGAVGGIRGELEAELAAGDGDIAFHGGEPISHEGGPLVLIGEVIDAVSAVDVAEALVEIFGAAADRRGHAVGFDGEIVIHGEIVVEVGEGFAFDPLDAVLAVGQVDEEGVADVADGVADELIGGLAAGGSGNGMVAVVASLGVFPAEAFLFVVSGHVGERVEVGAEVVGVVAAAVEEFAELEEVFADAGADPVEIIEVEGGVFGEGEISLLEDPGGAVGEVDGVFGFDGDVVFSGDEWKGKSFAELDVEGDFFVLGVEYVEADFVVEDDLCGPTGEVFGFLAVVSAAPAVEAFAVAGEGGGVFEGELEGFFAVGGVGVVLGLVDVFELPVGGDGWGVFEGIDKGGGGDEAGVFGVDGAVEETVAGVEEGALFCEGGGREDQEGKKDNEATRHNCSLNGCESNDVQSVKFV